MRYMLLLVTLMTTMKCGLIPMPRTHTGSVAVIHRVDASFRPCFLELLQASGCAHDVSRRYGRCGGPGEAWTPHPPVLLGSWDPLLSFTYRTFRKAHGCHGQRPTFIQVVVPDRGVPRAATGGASSALR